MLKTFSVIINSECKTKLYLLYRISRPALDKIKHLAKAYFE